MTQPPPPKHGRHLRWLNEQLPELIAGQVLDEDAASRIRAHYGLGSLADSRNLALLIFGALGALLVGGGLILIVAHNWEELSRAGRAAVALAMLLCAQCVCAYALLKKPVSDAWRESSALGLCLSLGASIALISQTYNLGGELGDFMLSWTVLALPIVYLMDARLTAAGLMLLVLPLPSATMTIMYGGLAYVLLLLLLMPYLIFATTRYPEQSRTRLVHLLFSLTLPLGITIVFAEARTNQAEDVILPMLACVYAVLHVIGSKWVETDAQSPPSFQSPLTTVGVLGLLGVVIATTFVDVFPWQGHEDVARAFEHWQVIACFVVVAVLSSLSTFVSIRELRARTFDQALLHGVPAIVLCEMALLAVVGSEPLNIGIGNLYALALCIALIAAGLSAQSLRRSNLGLTAITLLFMVRFADSELSLVARGLAMMLVGGGFVATNIWLLRQRRAQLSKSPNSPPDVEAP